MKACVIGAGSSGIAAAQVLQARGIDFDCFEKGSQVGGNWRYENDNGMSSAYRSLHINTSRRVMAFKSLPMPEGYPDYPDHFQMAAYFDEVVDRFRLRERIEFGTEVLSVVPVAESAGEWDVTIDGPGGRETRRYGAVLVANGHHWDARWPEPAFAGAEEFTGEQIHAHEYREPDVAPRQARARPRDRQLGRRHRGRVIADRRQDLPRHPPRRLGHPQVPERQADRRDRQLGHRARPDPGDAGGDAARR